LTIDQIDLIELNEPSPRRPSLASASSSSIPRGSTSTAARSRWATPGRDGARILTTLVHACVDHSRYGLATMCIGVGQGIAMIVERA